MKNQKKDGVRPKIAKWHFVSLLWTFITQALNGLLRHFQCLKSSAGIPLAVEKGPQSIAPLQAKLWPFKEGNCQKRTKIEAKVPLFGNPFSNLHNSGLKRSCAKIQKPQIISLAWASYRKGPRSSYGNSKRATIWGISPNLVKIAHLCSNTHFSSLEPKIQKPGTITGKCSCYRTGTQDSGTSGRQATATILFNWLYLWPEIISLKCLRILRRTWVHNTQGRQDKGSEIHSGGYLLRVFILACCQHINSLTAVLLINRCPDH